MLSNEEKGVVISFLNSVDSTFNDLEFDINEAPWNKRDSWSSPNPNEDLNYYVEVLIRNFIDGFIRNSIELIFNAGIINGEKRPEVDEFISKNFSVLGRGISSLRDKIFDFVKSFRNSVFKDGTNKGKDEQRKFYESRIPIIEAESKRYSDYYMIQKLSQIPWFNGQSYRMGQLKTHFTVKCSECGLDMHFYDEDLMNNSDLSSIVSGVLNYYIDRHCRDYDTGEIREDIEHEILLNFEGESFDHIRNPAQSIFSYELGLLHQHLSMVLEDGRKIHFDV